MIPELWHSTYSFQTCRNGIRRSISIGACVRPTLVKTTSGYIMLTCVVCMLYRLFVWMFILWHGYNLYLQSMNNMFYILGVVRATVIHQANQCWEKFNPTKHTIQANGQWHLLKQYVRLTSFFDRISVLLFSLKTLSAEPVLSISLQNLLGTKDIQKR